MDEHDRRWLRRAFTHHPPKDERTARYYEAVRQQGYGLAEAIMGMCPDTGDRSTALLKVREAVMWANASIACAEEADRNDTVDHP